MPFTGARDAWTGKPADGRGEMRWPNGDVYDGTWGKGQMHGLGCFSFANGSRYVGEFKWGLRHGQVMRGTHAEGRLETA